MLEIRNWSWEQCVSHGLTIRERIEKDLWELAELCAGVERQYGDGSAAKFGGEIGLSGRRVNELAQTWRAWETGDRSPILSVKHHTIAARAPFPQVIIREAEDKGWSTRELEKEVAKKEVEADLESMGFDPDEEERVIQPIEWRRRPCPHCDGEGEIYERIEDAEEERRNTGDGSEADTEADTAIHAGGSRDA